MRQARDENDRYNNSSGVVCAKLSRVFQNQSIYATTPRKENSRFKKLGLPKNERPPKPAVDDKNYPSKQQVALLLLQQFVVNFPHIKIQCVLADALYGARSFFSRAEDLLGVQIIELITACGLPIKKIKKFATTSPFLTVKLRAICS